MRRSVPVFAALLAMVPPAQSGDGAMQTITLADKSVIRAQVTELSVGYYHLKSPVLGEMRIPTSGVLSIQPDEPAPAAPSPAGAVSPSPSAPSQSSPAQADLSGLQSTVSSKVQSLMSSKEGMDAITAFSGNTDLKAVMNDPQLMKAIQSGDYQTLMNSPAMNTLLNSPQTQALIRSVLGPAPAAGQGGSPAPAKD